MKVPNWFRIVWWAVLLVLIGSILYARRDDLLTGHAVPADVLIFLVWVGLFLMPLFQEVNLFGLKLKQEIQELKKEVTNLRTEFRNTVDVRPQISLVPLSTFRLPRPIRNCRLWRSASGPFSLRCSPSGVCSLPRSRKRRSMSQMT